MKEREMRKYRLLKVTTAIIAALAIGLIVTVPGVQAQTSSYGLYGGLYGSSLSSGYGSSLYGGYGAGLYGSSLYGGLYGSSLYGGMYGGLYGSSLYGGLYGGLYGSSLYGGMYGGLYGSSLYGGMYGGLYGSSMYGGMYGGLYGSSMYGGMYGGLYGSSMYGGMYGLGSPFGVSNMYYSVDTGTGVDYQVPFLQIAPMLGMAGLYNQLFPQLFSSTSGTSSSAPANVLY
jgi:hypothetical protein